MLTTYFFKMKWKPLNNSSFSLHVQLLVPITVLSRKNVHVQICALSGHKFLLLIVIFLHLPSTLSFNQTTRPFLYLGLSALKICAFLFSSFNQIYLQQGVARKTVLVIGPLRSYFLTLNKASLLKKISICIATNIL